MATYLVHLEELQEGKSNSRALNSLDNCWPVKRLQREKDWEQEELQSVCVHVSSICVSHHGEYKFIYNLLQLKVVTDKMSDNRLSKSALMGLLPHTALILQPQ